MDNIRNKLEKLRNEVWHILQMDYSKRTDFIPGILGAIDGILETPKRNCDVGTPEEQSVRMSEFCREQYEKSDGIMLCSGCRFHGLEGLDCQFAWAQLPYESEVSNENLL